MAVLISIAKALELYRPRIKTLKVGMTPEDAAFELTELQNKVDSFETTANALAQAANLKADQTVVKEVANGKLEILRAAIDQVLNEKYKVQLRSFTDFENLKTFLQSVFGSILTDEEKLINARRQLDNAVRFIKENEPFAVFLGRIEAIGAIITKNSHAEFTKILLKDAFMRNLSPGLKSFLLEHGKNKDTLKQIADFLDSKRKHLHTTSTNSIEISSLVDLKEQNLKIEQQNADLQHQIAVLTQLVQTALNSPTEVEINKITQKALPFNSSTKQLQNRFTPAARRSDWIYRPDGKPVRCEQCGLFGHYAQKCPRTCTAICHNCGKKGHLQAVCRSAKNAK